MPVAVPPYLGNDFTAVSPGMRFGMYLNAWTGSWEKAQRPDWRVICALNLQDKERLAALQQRQRQLARFHVDASLFLHPALSTAPFTTGLGNEHPLENGFAFLWPYGMPYLPGSGVKGVIRQAVRELISGEWSDAQGWSQEKCYGVTAGREMLPLSKIDVLLGLESEDRGEKHFRGVLTFWDVLPGIKGDQLLVEVMTPHQKHYYQEGQAPHDSGLPVPIQFLTVPPGSAFNFFVVCDRPRLQVIAPDLAQDERWKTLLEAAFAHAFDWLGFGAKTAVGYGSMERDRQMELQWRAEKEEEERASRTAAMSEEERQIAALRQQLEQDRKAGRPEAGGPLNQMRLALLEQALEWQDPELRRQAADLLEETARLLPWARKRRQEVKEQLARLMRDG